jgi:hypothetical protein
VKLLFCLVLLAPICSTARADDDTETLYYLGAGVTEASVKHFVLNTTPGPQSAAGNVGPDISATSWKVLAGLRPLSWRWFGLEADYFGTAARTENPPLCNNCSRRSEASAIAGYLLVLLPAGQYVDVYLKVGPEAYSLKVVDVFGTNTDSGTRVGAGAGVQMHRGRLGLRLEYERLPAGLTNGMEFFSLAVTLSTR